MMKQLRKIKVIDFKPCLLFNISIVTQALFWQSIVVANLQLEDELSRRESSQESSRVKSSQVGLKPVLSSLKINRNYKCEEWDWKYSINYIVQIVPCLSIREV